MEGMYSNNERPYFYEFDLRFAQTLVQKREFAKAIDTAEKSYKELLNSSAIGENEKNSLILETRNCILDCCKRSCDELKKEGKHSEIVQFAKKMLILDQKNVDGIIAMSEATRALGMYKDAEHFFKLGLTIVPKNQTLLLGLGGIYYDEISSLKDYEKAIQIYEFYDKNYPNFISVLQVMSRIYSSLGLQKKSVETARRALKADPSSISGLSEFTWNQVKLNDLTQKEITKNLEEVIANFMTAKKVKINKYTYKKYKKPVNKKIHIGYLGSDFKAHVVQYFLEPLIENHNKKDFTISCYYVANKHDAMTEKYKSYADNFIECDKLTPEEIADKIHADKVDILVDLAGPTGNIKLEALAYKPAPIQCCYLGFPSTYGIKQIDYIFSDKDTIFKGEEDFYTEKPAYIEQGYEVFKIPVECIDKKNTSSPCLKNGYVTFGAFNSPHKITNEVLDAYSRILDKVPNSKLLFHNFNNYRERMQKRYVDFFENKGISKERLIFRNNTDNGYDIHNEMMLESDIALDSFPYNGTTTTCWSLCLGLPVIAFVGQTSMSRSASRILKHIGLNELVGQNVDDFIEIAVNLANDKERIEHYRKNIRKQFENSKMTDFKGFAQSVEDMYKRIMKPYLVK